MIDAAYRNLPYKYAYLMKRIYHLLLAAYHGMRNLLSYGTTDMYNVINIETSTLCNRRCKYCPNSIYDRSLQKNQMPTELFKKIIDELSDLHFAGRLSPHTFNEPLLEDRLADLMAYAHEKLPRARLEIYTNGDFLDVNILERLYKAGVSHYVVTLHGSNEERRLNRKRIEDLIKYVRTKKYSIRIKLIEFKPGTPLDTRAGLVSVEVRRHPGDVSCLYPVNPLTIRSDGKVLLCCVDYLGEVFFGNVRFERLMDIWKKESYRNRRKQIKNKIYVTEMCKRCMGV